MNEENRPQVLSEKEKRRLVLKRRLFYIIIVLDILFTIYLVYQFITLFSKK